MELKVKKMYGCEAYTRARVFLRKLESSGKELTPNQFVMLKERALDGDIEGAYVSMKQHINDNRLKKMIKSGVNIVWRDLCVRGGC